MSRGDVSLLKLTVVRMSTAQQVAAAIREQLLRGEVAPGTKLREQEIASSLAVSRHAVREAMQILGSEGLVRLALHRAVEVADLGSDDVRDVYRARRALELAGVRASAHADEAWSSNVHEHLRVMHVAASEGNMHDLLEADRGFHEAMVAPIGSVRIDRFYRNIETQIRLTRAWYGERAAPEIFYKRHKDVVDALDRRDYEGAELLLGAVIDDGQTRLLGQLQRREALLRGSDVAKDVAMA